MKNITKMIIIFMALFIMAYLFLAAVLPECDDESCMLLPIVLLIFLVIDYIGAYQAVAVSIACRTNKTLNPLFLRLWQVAVALIIILPLILYVKRYFF